MDNSLIHIRERFEQIYGESPTTIFFAPGRVNLIGEHIDYNAGLVFPCALTVGTFMAIRQRADRKICLQSLNFEEKLCVEIESLNKTAQWFDYPIGVLKLLQSEGAVLAGMDILYYGTIPNGAGLSSSASIEVVTAYAVNQLFEMKLSTIALVKLSQEVENNFIGVNCGIMDQFAVGMGKENHAIALNCDSLDYQYVPLVLDDYTLLIGNTKVQRKLADSKYNERLAECAEALEIINKTYNVANLCELNLEKLEAIKSQFINEVIYKRAKHVVTEQERVIKAIDCLKDNKLQKFGQLMNESHDSLRDDYEVTGNALDIMVSEGRKINGVLGSRMTGAGFGGCIVTLLHKDSVDNFIKNVGKAYEAKLNIEPEFYAIGVGNGVMELKTSLD